MKASFKSQILNGRGYSLQTAVRFGIKVSMKEYEEQVLVQVSDAEDKLNKFYTISGIWANPLKNGYTEYYYVDIAPYLTKEDKADIKRQISAVKNSFVKKYKEKYKYNKEK